MTIMSSSITNLQSSCPTNYKLKIKNNLNSQYLNLSLDLTLTCLFIIHETQKREQGLQIRLCTKHSRFALLVPYRKSQLHPSVPLWVSWTGIKSVKVPYPTMGLLKTFSICHCIRCSIQTGRDIRPEKTEASPQLFCIAYSMCDYDWMNLISVPNKSETNKTNPHKFSAIGTAVTSPNSNSLLS